MSLKQGRLSTDRSFFPRVVAAIPRLSNIFGRQCPISSNIDGLDTRALFLSSSWKELSGSELQQASSIFQENHASKSKSIPGGGEEAEAVSCSDRKLWERFGARYFKGTVSSKQGGKERIVHVHVEVRWLIELSTPVYVGLPLLYG